jgi:hypothetical protein
VSQRVLTETVISLYEARDLMPRPVSYETVTRWVKTGIRGVVLESARFGWRIVTSKEAVHRFLEALNTEPAGTSAELATAG